MSDTETDQLLVKKAQKGDHLAYELLVKKYQSRILIVLAKMLKNQEDAKDMAQEVFIKAYRSLPNFRQDSQFYTWLYRIAINSAKNFLTSKHHRQSELTDVIDDEQGTLDHPVEINTPETAMLTGELEQTILAAVAALPAELKQAISLREFDGLSYEDIAKIMQCPVGTVRSRIFRAREAIDEKVQRLTDQFDTSHKNEGLLERNNRA